MIQFIKTMTLLMIIGIPTVFGIFLAVFVMLTGSMRQGWSAFIEFCAYDPSKH